MTRVPEELVMRFLDGELAGAEEEAALHRIAADPEARALLRFDAGLRDSLGPSGPARVPEGFAGRVMAAIAAREARREESTAGSPAAAGSAGWPAGRPAGRVAPEAEERQSGWLERVRRELVRPRTLVWRPVHALAGAAVAAAVALLVVGLPTGDAAREGRERLAEAGPAEEVEAAAPWEAESVLVRFVFEDQGAESVAVAGDFSRWEPVPLARRWSEGRLIWTGVVAIPRGEHRYMFVVDGSRWVTDPLATAVRDDGFGNRNAILSL